MPPYASTFLNIQDSIIDKLRLDPVLDRTRTREWANQYLLDVALTSRYFTGAAVAAPLSAGATSAPLPPTLLELSWMTSGYGGQTITMAPVGMEQILMRRQLDGSSGGGQPCWYSLQKNLVEFWPTSSGGETLTFYGSTVPDEMIADTDVSGLPEPFAINLLVYGACIEAADFKSDVKLYFWYQQAYQTWLGKFQSFLNRRITQSSRSIPIFGPDGRPFDMTGWVPNDMGSDFWVTGAR